MSRRAAALHILVKTQKQCQELRTQLEQGANFQQLARKHSICPSAKRGGELGEFKQGVMAPAFDKAVFKGPELQVQGPVKTRFGYHLIKVLYKR
ncbi:peptidylprolyl isomerase PpiC [Lacimicrobium alkaliphilum]|uniref:peptidylprolyl isomerase n=1 Tax=Lacimicrobium alkaliphilum TaxID=1526571 RepID=A0ABQ1RSN1_9ALTE|nr:peptidylprolyl isomerase PpiC [Lacimicrobium alkaliphilum]GGD78204.1 peptidylprolyl isomerase [Lacimicrobium alkaliphilum]